MSYDVYGVPPPGLDQNKLGIPTQGLHFLVQGGSRCREFTPCCETIHAIVGAPLDYRMVHIAGTVYTLENLQVQRLARSREMNSIWYFSLNPGMT